MKRDQPKQEMTKRFNAAYRQSRLRLRHGTLHGRGGFRF